MEIINRDISPLIAVISHLTDSLLQTSQQSCNTNPSSSIAVIASPLASLFHLLRISIPYYKATLLSESVLTSLFTIAIESFSSYQNELIREVCAFLESVIICNCSGQDNGCCLSSIQQYSSSLIHACVGSVN